MDYDAIIGTKGVDFGVVGLARLSWEVEATNDERQRHLADHVAWRMLREHAPSPHGDSDSDEDPCAQGSPKPMLGHVPGYVWWH